jgi:hypothetical protein
MSASSGSMFAEFGSMFASSGSKSGAFGSKCRAPGAGAGVSADSIYMVLGERGGSGGLRVG